MKNYTVEEIKNAIDGSKGSITEISKRLGCEWHIAKKYVEMHDETKRYWIDEIEKNKDKAESNILKSIDTGDIQTSKWYLQTIGKDRGYTEKQEISHGGEVNIKVKLPDEI